MWMGVCMGYGGDRCPLSVVGKECRMEWLVGGGPRRGASEGEGVGLYILFILGSLHRLPSNLPICSPLSSRRVKTSLNEISSDLLQWCHSFLVLQKFFKSGRDRYVDVSYFSPFSKRFLVYFLPFIVLTALILRNTHFCRFKTMENSDRGCEHPVRSLTFCSCI